MTPNQLAKSNSEHGHQRALFAWLNMAERFGFAAAWDEGTYAGHVAPYIEQQPGVGHDVAMTALALHPVPELAWIHAIPNGGLRDKRTAAMLKAEGVKRGIPDVFLPLPLWGTIDDGEYRPKVILYAGLYVEMKRPDSERGRKGRTSAEQNAAIDWLRHSGYAVSVCLDWETAAREIQAYVEQSRKGA